MTEKIALIGCGNMGGAIVKGAVAAKTLLAENVYLFDPATTKARELADALGGAHVCDSGEDAVAQAAIVLFAVKPHLMEKVMVGLGKALDDTDAIIVSVAAGVSTSDIEAYTPALATKRIVRIMPNINASIRMSVSAICGCGCCEDEDVARVETIFKAVGTTHRIAESQFSNFMALAGCSPAWTYRYIDALAQAAVAHGMTKAQATQIAAEAVIGSATMLAQEARDKGTVAQQLVDYVCSPSGTTVAGLLAAEDAGFSPAVRAAVNAAIKRDAELA